MADNNVLSAEAMADLPTKEAQPTDADGEEVMEVAASADVNLAETEAVGETGDLATPDSNTVDAAETGSGDEAMADQDSTDPYAYTKDGKFTSEIFKIEIQNLPFRVGFGQLKKRLHSLGLKPVKVKIIDPNMQQCFVTFRNDADRDEAITKCTDHYWKGKTLLVKKALPAPDPLVRKRKLEAEAEAETGPQVKMAKDDKQEPTAKDKLNQVVTPFYHMPYEEQLQKKQDEIKVFLKKLGRDVQQNNYDYLVNKYLGVQRIINKGLICILEPIKKSPDIYGYRNKCEFTIGMSPAGEDNTVGFRMGRYNKGLVTVVEVDECVHVPELMKKVTKAMQNYLQETSHYAAYDPVKRSGHWRQLTLRTNTQGSIMVIVSFHPQSLAQEELTAVREQVAAYFQPGGVSECDITSMYFVLETERGSDAKQEEHLFGDMHINEQILGVHFRISPGAFFQVNVAATEVLYSTVADWCCVSDKTVLLDVCCGTGTIGLTMAKRAAKTVGVELCEQAIEDAKANALFNEITNAEFHCSKAETFLPAYMRSLSGSPVVAVVDPPRGGLHGDVVRGIRRCTLISRVIYISCNPNGARQNLIDLTRQESKRMIGKPFRLVRAVAVDLFPHTSHCELVMMLDRSEAVGDVLQQLRDQLATEKAEPAGAQGSGKDSGKAEESSKDSGKAEESSKDSGKAEESSKDSGKAEESSVDSGKAEESSKDSGKAEESSKDSGKAEESSKDSGKAEESGKDSGKAEESGKDSGKAEEPAKDSGKAEESSKDSGNGDGTN